MKKILATAFVAAFLFLGCGSRINNENYQKLEVGMTYEQVVAILGKPDICDSVLGARNCEWGDAEKHISVQFLGDKVVLFSSKGI